MFPEDQEYWIATRLNPVIHDVTVDWKGTWMVCKSVTQAIILMMRNFGWLFVEAMM